MYNTNLPNRAELPSASRLLRSTGIAAVIANVLLFTVILPAEYGIDPTGAGRFLGLTKMGEIKASLAAEDKANEVKAQSAVVPETKTSAVKVGASDTQAAKQDTTTVVLKPDQAVEFKMTMAKGGTVKYEWSATGAGVNFDTHGDSSSVSYFGYGKGKNATADTGTLTAEFDGKHGWYWRNRSDVDVTVTLKTNGQYQKIERML